MKILKRSKGILRFKLIEKNITLEHGENEISERDFELLKNHPSYEALSKTSQIVIMEETKEEAKEETMEELEGLENLDSMNHKQLVEIANKMELETKGLNKKQLIKLIKSVE
jgi:hypothetical protein